MGSEDPSRRAPRALVTSSQGQPPPGFACILESKITQPPISPRRRGDPRRRVLRIGAAAGLPPGPPSGRQHLIQ
jgi:hypothetical protein